MRTITPCIACRGRGSTIDQPCPDCRGRGQVEREETLTVKVPVGAEEGMALRVPGRGQPPREPGGTPGDLFVVVHTAPDARFERRGADLWRAETIGLADATLGTRLTVPTPEDHATVTVPPGTQPDTVLRLRGKGLPEFGGGRRGNLYVVARVRIPEHVSREERELYERLRTLSRQRTAEVERGKAS
jgi:molecular chaperone DnaJ